MPFQVERLINLQAGLAQRYDPPFCLEKRTANCIQAKTFNTCRICQKGYYLDPNQQCQPNPKDIIPNCVIYKNPTTCIQCKDNMFPINETSCVSPAIPVANCLVYNSTTNFISCISCTKDYYLSEPNVCTLRTPLSQIPNCVTISLTSETCAQCAANFTSTSDYGACLPSIKNCLTYQSTSYTSTKQVCAQCVNYFYYKVDTDTCVKGTKDYCLVYMPTSNDCATCFNKFYLKNGICVPHDELYLCDQYSNQIANTCSVCKSSAFLFTRKNTCVPVTIIPFCVIYDTTTTCKLCQDNYKLTDIKTCALIPIERFCMQVDPTDRCIKCHKNYLLRDDGICEVFNDELLYFCASNNLDGLIPPSSLVCNYCNANSIPLNMKNTYSCVENFRVPANLLTITNCEQFNPANVACDKCKPDYVLRNGLCVTACASIETLYLHRIDGLDTNGDGINDSYSVTGVNVCGAKIDNCKIAAPDLVQTSPAVTDYSCVQCDNGMLPIVKLDNRGTIARIQSDKVITGSPFSLRPSLTCLNPTILTNPVSTFRPLVNNAIENCDFYAQIATWTGCVKCRHTFRGVVFSPTFGCKTYNSNNDCVRCLHGFWLNGKLCNRVTPIPNCDVYFNEGINGCVECRERFFLSANGIATATPYGTQDTISVGTACTPRTNFVTSCAGYNKQNEVCNKCIPGYFLNPSTFLCYPTSENCKTPAYSQNDATLVVCTVCNDGFYLKNSICYKGDIDNCKTYADAVATQDPNVFDNENKCATCLNGFYLSSNLCLPHLPMTLCTTTNQANLNTCDLCNKNAFRFKIINTCAPYIKIDNCIKYANVYQCQTCATGYYLTNYGQRCLQIPAISGCKETKSEKECTVCKPGFYLNNKKCLSYFQDILFYCDTNVGMPTDGKNDRQVCGYCLNTPVNANGDGIEYMNLNGNYRCVEKNLIRESGYSSNADVTPDFLIQNCERYDFVAAANGDKQTSKCVSCKAPYILASDQKSCIKDTDCFGNANSEVFLSKYTSPAATTIKKATNAICGQAADANNGNGPFNCYLSPISVQSTGNQNIVYQCAQCKAGFIAVLDLNANNAPTFVVQKNIGQKVTPYSIYPTVTCVDKTGLTIWGTTNTYNLVSFCSYYVLNGGEYYCYKCNFGFQGSLAVKTVNAAKVYYISKCTYMTDCDTNQRYEGITTNILEKGATNPLFNYHFTCHVCKASDSKPVAFVVMQKANNAYQGIDSYKLYYTTNQGTYAGTDTQPASFVPYDVKCEDGVKVGSPSAGKFTVANCALYAAHVGANDAALEYNCVACASGYSPTRASLSSPFVTSCSNASNNIVASTPPVFNGGKCSAGNAYFYTFSDGINLTTCKPHPDINCFAANSNNSKCDVCNRDSTMNAATSKCEKKTVPYCTSPTTNDPIGKSLNSYAFYLGSDLGSCESCSNGKMLGKDYPMIGDSVEATQNVCIVKNPPTVVVIPTKDNCKTVRYNLIKSAYQCTECNTGYIVTLDGECASATLNPNCTLVSVKDGTYCVNCINNTISKSGKCVAKSIANCLVYKDSSLLSYIRCAVCEDYYYEELDYKLYVSTCKPAAPLLQYNCASYITIFIVDTDKVYCTRCKSNYVLVPSANLAAAQNNPADDINRRILDSVCLPFTADNTDLANCSEWDPVELYTNNNLKCTTCISNLERVPTDIPNDKKKSVCLNIERDPFCLNFGLDTNTYQINNDAFKCIECQRPYYINATNNVCTLRVNTPLIYCKTVAIQDDKCNECIDGYFLDPSKTICNPTPSVNYSPSPFNGFLSACSPLNECTPDFIDGIDLNIASLLSCHKCADPTFIPFLVVSGGYPYSSIKGLQAFNLQASNVTTGWDFGRNGESNMCLAPQSGTFSIPQALWTFPANCAIGILNANAVPDSSHSTTLTGINLSKIAVFCGACQPGFKAVIGTTLLNGVQVPVPNMIAQCQAISNCDVSNWMNYCTQCAPGYSFEFNSTLGTLYNSCVPNKGITDCYSFDPTSGTCIICNPGKILNRDGFCDRIRTPRCLVNEYSIPVIYRQKDIATALFLSPQIVGCSKCEPGYTAIMRSSDLYICSESSYKAKALMTSTTKFVFNCKNYFVDSQGTLKCKFCNEGGVVKEDGGSCIDSSTLQNCRVAMNNITCVECNTGFVLVNRACVPQSLQNCVTYGNNAQSTSQICIKCAFGFYLEANLCLRGNVTNCFDYETKTRCNLCNPGYQLVIKSNGEDYCYPLDSSLNCKTYDAKLFQDGVLSCAECVNSTMIPSFDQTLFRPNHCLRYTQIQNCVEYNLTNTIKSIADSSFGCIRCLGSYYVKGEVCEIRTNLNPNCTTYSINADRCAICNNGFYVTDAGTCELFPSGVTNCKEYATSSKCSACANGFYLNNNLCMPVPTANLITGCIKYLSVSACDVCQDGMIVNGQNCTAVQALNCLTAASQFACSTCQPGYVLVTQNNLLNCVAGSIPNCQVYENKEPIRCNTCQSNFYPSNGTCVAVTNTILGCVIYDSATTCLLCESDAALSVDKTQCLMTEVTYNSIDSYCNNSVVTKSPFCSACSFGYYLKEGGCVPCTGMDQSCLSCDPLNPSVCLICATGYFMNSGRTCEKYTPWSFGSKIVSS